MKKVLLTLALAALGCSLPVRVSVGTETPAPEATQTPTPPPPATPQPGSEGNPLILALSPSLRPPDELISAGETIAAFLQSQTGYRIAAVVPASETALVDSISKGNAHIVSLSPYGYALAREGELVAVLLARVRDGEIFYGAQIIARGDRGFISFYDPARDENTADPAAALKQFNDRKACWSDEVSPSGYVVPLGLLNQAQVQIRSGAFLDGQTSVVRAVYADDICDFGATFIDARASPALEADYPDVMEKVIVIWRIPKIIPYENIAIASSLPFEMRRVIQRAFLDLMLTPEGRAAMQTVYGFDEVQVVEDAAYAEFITHLKASGLDLTTLIK